MPEGKPIPLEFPGKGIDVTREYQLQPPGTTPDALNVRSRDSIAQRNRGGSRPGYSPYIPQIIPEGAVLIQHLNFIVDPTVDALPQNFFTPDPDWIPDPRFPGILVPPGGAPWQPNPNTAPPPGITFVEGVADGGAALSQNIVFSQAIPLGRLIVVVVSTVASFATNDGDPAATVSIAGFTRVGSYQRQYAFVNGLTYDSCGVSLWYKVAGVAESQTVTITEGTGTVTIFASGATFSGVLTVAPVEDDSGNAGGVTVAGNGSLAAGDVDATENGAVIVGFGNGVGSLDSISANHSSATGPGTWGARSAIFYKKPLHLPADQPTDITVSFTAATEFVRGVLAISVKKAP